MIRRCSALLIVAAGAACGGGDGTGPAPAAGVDRLAGNGQPGVVGTELPNPLLVKVTDVNGKALKGITVSWAAAGGGGSVTPATTATDAEGLAKTAWTLGPSTGEQTVTAAVQGLTPVTFTATAAPGPVAAVRVTPDSVVLGFIGDTARLQASVTDRFGNPLPSPSFTWVSLDTTYAVVDAGGLVRARRPGSVKVTASAVGKADTAAVRISDAVVAPRSAGNSLSAGGAHTCGLTGSETAYCWGSSGGQLGTTQPVENCDGQRCSTRPVAVAGGVALSRISAGELHTCGLTPQGKAYCWGNNDTGAVGDGTLMLRATPVPVSGDLAFTSVSAGYYYTCGLTVDGRAYCWGGNDFGQLGNGTTTRSLVPIPVAGDLSFRSLHAGGQTTCGIAVSGVTYCWGSNRYGQVGNLSAVSICLNGTQCSTTPLVVQGGIEFSSVMVGNGFVCGVAPAGVGYCWGLNDAGQLGTTAPAQSCYPLPMHVCHRAPAPVAGGLAFKRITPGGQFTCAVTLGGEAYCWGANRAGELGVETTTESCSSGGNTFPCSMRPVRVSGGLAFQDLDAGDRHTCSIGADGWTYCWGLNYSGRLGDGTLTNRSSPTRVMMP